MDFIFHYLRNGYCFQWVAYLKQRERFFIRNSPFENEKLQLRVNRLGHKKFGTIAGGMNIKPKYSRRFHRINIDEEVNLELTGDAYSRCRIKNMSVGGMFIAGCSPQENMENCKVNIYNNQKTKKLRFQASVSVVWSNEEGVGLKFTAMNPDSYMFLRTTLINNAEQPAAIIYDLARACPFEITNA